MNLNLPSAVLSGNSGGREGDGPLRPGCKEKRDFRRLTRYHVCAMKSCNNTQVGVTTLPFFVAKEMDASQDQEVANYVFSGYLFKFSIRVLQPKSHRGLYRSL